MHGPRTQRHERGRDVLAQVEERGRTGGLTGLLGCCGRRPHGVEARDRVGFTDGQRHGHRSEPVAERELLARVAHRDRAEDPQRQVRGQLTPCVQQPGETASDTGEHDVVDGATERAAHRLDVVERDAHEPEATVAPDRVVQ